MDINEIEKSIIDRLKTHIKPIQLKIEPLPDKVDKYNVAHPKGAILVHYKGSNFSKSLTLGDDVFEKTLNIDIYLQIKNLRRKKGLNDWIDIVYAILASHKINGYKLIPKNDKYAGFTPGIWHHTISFTLNQPFVEGYSDDSPEEFPLLKKLTYQDNETNQETIIESTNT